jgi:hypothetical protein
MRVRNHKARHRLSGRWNYVPIRFRDYVPSWLRPSTWILTTAMFVAVTYTYVFSDINRGTS